MYPWGIAVSMQLPHIAKVDLVQQRVVYPIPVFVQAWTTRFRLAIDRVNKQAKEAIQSDGTIFSMHNATVQQPLTSNEAMDALRTFRSAVNGVEWYKCEDPHPGHQD
ncbi:hypothetical protein TNCV_2583551 [Trichonephila clavipes]|nr:hypothetical protein TNCV_2583551 [Trichonephila clavipes]